MALTKDDLKAVGKVVMEAVNKAINTQVKGDTKWLRDVVGEEINTQVKGDTKWLEEVIDGRLLDFSGKVLEPGLDGVVDDLKKEISKNRQAVGKNKRAIDKLAVKVGNVDRRFFRVSDHQAEKFDDHEKRIVSLETQRLIMRG